ncbi:amino-acid N-acetyltransferase [Mycolicibacterium fortuitum]
MFRRSRAWSTSTRERSCWRRTWSRCTRRCRNSGWPNSTERSFVGCGALHVLWADLGEVRTVAVHPKVRGTGVGHLLVEQLLDVARELHLSRIFVLTFEVDFFGKHGFEEIDGTPVTAEVYEEMCRSYDTGVAEFLDLSYVKPNTLGNTRMLLTL